MTPMDTLDAALLTLERHRPSTNLGARTPDLLRTWERARAALSDLTEEMDGENIDELQPCYYYNPQGKLIVRDPARFFELGTSTPGAPKSDVPFVHETESLDPSQPDMGKRFHLVLCDKASGKFFRTTYLVCNGLWHWHLGKPKDKGPVVFERVYPKQETVIAWSSAS